MNYRRTLAPRVPHRLPSWRLQFVSCVLIAAELLVPCNSQVLRAAEQLLTPAPAPVAAARERAFVLTPQNVTVNRTTPQVDPPPAQPVFSDAPTDQEIFQERVFVEPLVPMEASTPEENRGLAQALEPARMTTNEELTARSKASGSPREGARPARLSTKWKWISGPVPFTGRLFQRVVNIDIAPSAL